MAKIISLSAARKAQDRAKARQQADENAVKFGRTKDQKRRDSDAAQRHDRALDGAKRLAPGLDGDEGALCPPDR